MKARVLVSGNALGEVLHLGSGISFWGGVDPLTGLLIDPRHPRFGDSLSGRIITMNQSTGSSSGSSILLEMLARGTQPAGIVLGVPDQVLTLASIVAREMGLRHIPVIQLDPENFDSLPRKLRIGEDGSIEAC